MSFPKLNKKPIVVRIHEDYHPILRKIARKEKEPTKNMLCERLIIEQIPRLKRKWKIK